MPQHISSIYIYIYIYICICICIYVYRTRLRRGTAAPRPDKQGQAKQSKLHHFSANPRVLQAFGPRGRFSFGVVWPFFRLWRRLNYVFYERSGLEGASEALKRFGRSKTTCFTSVSDASALRPLKNNVFYDPFDRSTDRERASSFRTHAKTMYFTSFSIDRPIDRIARSSETLEKHVFYERFDRPTDRESVTRQSYVFYEHFGRECASHSQKQRISQPFRSTDRSRASLGLSGPLWASLGLSGPLWASLGLSGDSLGLSGPL